MSEFDKFADSYRETMRQTLAMTLTSDEYQAEYKTKLIKQYASRKREINKILDFGCGVGLSIPSLRETFPNSKLFITDVSKGSLNIAHQKFPEVTVVEPDLSLNEEFDVIFLSTVLHHITSANRIAIFEVLKSKLSKDGCIFIVEHNTYNPLTRKIVSNCPMDVDAELISISDLKKLLISKCGLTVRESGFCSYFPQPLKVLAKFDRALKRLPLGGQYFVLATAD